MILDARDSLKAFTEQERRHDMHIVKTWGEVRETVEYLELNMYEEVKHIFGKYYFCRKLGFGLMDVSILV